MTCSSSASPQARRSAASSSWSPRSAPPAPLPRETRRSTSSPASSVLEDQLLLEHMDEPGHRLAVCKRHVAAEMDVRLDARAVLARTTGDRRDGAALARVVDERALSQLLDLCDHQRRAVRLAVVVVCRVPQPVAAADGEQDEKEASSAHFGTSVNSGVSPQGCA